jgi:hypothetical protein
MTAQVRVGRLLAAISGFGLIASCEWLESATVPEHLRACPGLARTYFAHGTQVVERDIASHDLDTQYTIYICGNQYMHPPWMLTEGFVARGGTAASYLKRKLMDPGIPDPTVRDIVDVFADMARQSTYDVKGDSSLVALMESRSARIRAPEWRAYVQGKVREIRNQ